MYPRVRIHMDKLRQNLDACAGLIRQVPGCTLMIVTKGVCAYPPIVRMIAEHPAVDFVADSRIQNLKSYAGQVHRTGNRQADGSACPCTARCSRWWNTRTSAFSRSCPPSGC